MTVRSKCKCICHQQDINAMHVMPCCTPDEDFLMKCTCYQSTTAGDGRINCRKEGCAAIHNIQFAALSPDIVAKVRERNPNNCSTCEWKAHDDAGHCYLFFNEPEGCLRHTGRRKILVVDIPRKGGGLVASHALLCALFGDALESVEQFSHDIEEANNDREDV